MKAVFAFLLTFLGVAGFAQNSSRFSISRNVIAAGGMTFGESTRFQLGSTVGQPLAAVPSSTRFSVQGGFWIWPSPIVFAPTKTGNTLILSIQTEQGKTYTVQYVNSVTDRNWQNLCSIAGNGAVETVTNSVANVEARFYRIFEH